MNRRKIAFAAAVWALLWAGSLWLYDQKMLDKPLFFPHYYQVDCSEEQCEAELHYLVNRNQELKLVAVQIPGVQEPIRVRAFDHRNVNNYQKMQSAQLTIPVASQLPQSARQIKVMFEDGSRQTVEIGELRFSKDQPMENLVDFMSSSGSSDGSHATSFRAITPFRITGITVSPPVLTANDLQIKINGKPLSELTLPLQVAANDQLTVSSFFHPPADDSRAHAFYQLQIGLILQTANGKAVTYPVRVHLQPELSRELIDAYLREKEL